MTLRVLRAAEAASWAGAVVVTPPAAGGAGSVAQVIADMYSAAGPWNSNKGSPWAKSDDKSLGGVRGYSWDDGADNWAATFPNDGSAVRPWFWVGEPLDFTTGYDLKLEIKTPIYQFLISGTWTSQTALTNPHVHNFGAFGAPGVGDQGDITRTTETGDGATAFSWPLTGLSGSTTYYAHGWWESGGGSGGGYSLTPANATAVHISCQMRLKTNVSGDPAAGKFVGVMGADKITFPSGVYTNVGGYGQSRAKWVTDQWQPFSFTSPSTFGIAQLTANPPSLQVAS